MNDSKLLAAAIDTVTEGLTVTGSTAGFSNQTLIDLIPGAINVLLGLLGIVALAFTIYAGILYLTSQGNKDAVEKAKKVLTYSAIGMVLIVASYAISNYLLGALISLFSE
ncbi:MAG: hypothetical protein WC702_03550 [Patescibacteria group bacterium]|jgi:hypothetical protein